MDRGPSGYLCMSMNGSMYARMYAVMYNPNPLWKYVCMYVCKYGTMNVCSLVLPLTSS